tara:strand:- start:364 stop:1044 length:681 start_codon:yes stop_codon:yes gene_type:complete
MNWQDEGYLLSKRKFRENANIINVFTNSFGKVSGIVYGGNSRKIRNFLQLSNKIFIVNNTKNENKIGYLKTEIIEPISPKYFNDKEKTSALLSLTSILNNLLPELQPNKKIYKSINDLILNFDKKNWIISYIFWELNLIKELGYDANLKQFNTISSDKLKQYNLEIDGVRYIVPSFLIENKLIETFSKEDIKKGLFFTRLMFVNKFFLPNKLIFPKSRIILENYFN